MKKTLIVILILIIGASLQAQIGGNGTYMFLNLTNSARVAALGGKNISVNDNDLNLAVCNPALLTEATNKNIALNYVNYYAGIKYGYAAYSINIDSVSSIGTGMQYINYGNFIGADKTGKQTGDFTASDYALNLIYSRSLNMYWRVGATIKPVYSIYEAYTSVGMAADLGVTYTTVNKFTTAALVLRNIGSQFTTYAGNQRNPLPFEIQLGYTQKLEHAPFRYSITAQQLQKYDLSYTVPNKNTPDFNDGETSATGKYEKIGDNILRHLIFGVEFVPSKNFWIGIAYNYQRRTEMRVEQKDSWEGMSIGAGMRVSKFNISYGRSQYHLAGSTNLISVATNLGGW